MKIEGKSTTDLNDIRNVLNNKQCHKLGGCPIIKAPADISICIILGIFMFSDNSNNSTNECYLERAVRWLTIKNCSMVVSNVRC
jgi:hypothetical protein